MELIIGLALSLYVSDGPKIDKVEPLKLGEIVDNIEGIYYCTSDDAEYAGTVKKYKDMYIFQWSTEASGFGIRTGDIVSVNWRQPIMKDGKEITVRGITHYRIRKVNNEVHLTGRFVITNGASGQDEMILMKRFKVRD